MFMIRDARPADAAAISTILSDCIDETPWLPKVHDASDRHGFGEFLISRTEVSVAAMGDRPVGFLSRRGGRVEALYVARNARRSGIGRALLAKAGAVTGEIELWTFQANAPARAFYARLGFAEVEATDGQGNDENLPDVRLVWRAEVEA